MLVLHANWFARRMCLWAESLDACLAHLDRPVPVTTVATGGGATTAAVAAVLETAATPTPHPFLVTPLALARTLEAAHGLPAQAIDRDVSVAMRLPADAAGPRPSDRLATALGIDEPTIDPWLAVSSFDAAALAPSCTLPALLRLEDVGATASIDFGHELRYWFDVGRLLLDLLADQRFIPTLMQARDRGMRGAWRPWLHDDETRGRVGALVEAMPPVLRATVDEHQHRPWPILDEVLTTLTDAAVRRTLLEEDFLAALDERDDTTDAHAAWLTGLLGADEHVPVPLGSEVEMLRDASTWVGRLDETGRGQPARLCLELHDPALAHALPEMEPVSESITWRLSLHLAVGGDEHDLVEAAQIWSGADSAEARLRSGGVEHSQELLVSELARAARIYDPLESALSEAAPTGIDLTTAEAYAFLREFRPVLEEAGVIVIVPAWWDQPTSRLGLRMQIDSPQTSEMLDGGATGTAAATSRLGLRSLVNYRWQIAVGDQPLSVEAFQRLMRLAAPLVRVEGRWVEIDPDDLRAAATLLAERAGGEMTILEAVQTAYGVHGRTHGLPVLGLDATGWVNDLLGATNGDVPMPELEQPRTFQGALRPYQKRGLSWLSFLDAFGLGACLADDMGLGKTIQLIALLLHEREEAADGAPIGPTLLIVPTSLIGNWTRELGRFAPSLTWHVQHGPDRPTGAAFASVGAEHDVVITTYALVARDRETLQSISWRRVVLDEAQYIKNPPTKQTTAIRALPADRRVTLTGTPVENRLSELWSIMEFCNPGHLGHQSEFRRRFALPIERRHDDAPMQRLRHLVRPFVLRRLKTDPDVIQDLPRCFETKEFANLTTEQAALYQQVVDAMLTRVDRTEGIQRRGLVLATLTRLKQICNHPAQYLETVAGAGARPAATSPEGAPAL
ncbi:MAG: DEAD/DEAH box helicase, partial [Planctomycetota bacterium]